MPAPKTANPATRKGPAFKPPRSVKGPAQPAKPANTTKRASGPTAPASRSTGVTKVAAPSRPIFEAPTLISSSESEREEPNTEDEHDSEMDDAPEGDAPEAISQPTMDPIPPNLLARILHEGFENSDTKIDKGAMELTGKYMEIFVREAIARARFERADAKRGNILDGHLQVEDLERLAPQLVLDF